MSGVQLLHWNDARHYLDQQTHVQMPADNYTETNERDRCQDHPDSCISNSRFGTVIHLHLLIFWLCTFCSTDK